MMLKQKLRCIAAASSNITTAALSCSSYHSGCWFNGRNSIRSVHKPRIKKEHFPGLYKNLRSESFTVEIDKKDSKVSKERGFSVDRSGLFEGSVRRISQNDLMDIGVGKGAQFVFRLPCIQILTVLPANRTIHSTGERTLNEDIHERPHNIT